MNAADEATVNAEVESFMQGLIRRNYGEPEFHQAVCTEASRL